MLWIAGGSRRTRLWVKSHLTLELLAQYPTEAHAAIGNSCADVLADKGAALNQLLLSDRAHYTNLVDLTRKVQLRLVTVLAQLEFGFTLLQKGSGKSLYGSFRTFDLA